MTKTFTKYFLLLSTLYILFSNSLLAQTIAEKKGGLQRLNRADLDQNAQKLLPIINQQINQKKAELKSLCAQVEQLHKENAPHESFKRCLKEIHEIRQEISHLNTQWRETVSQSENNDSYALWHQPETTLDQLVNDYGSQDYVYLIPQEIAEMRLSINSNLPIPRASWGDMLEMILLQNGVAIRQINPYVRELYLVKHNHSAVRLITSQREDLHLYPPDTRMAFLLAPEPSEIKRVFHFLEKFINPNSTVIESFGRDLLIVGQVSELHDVIKLYDFVINNHSNKEYKIISLSRIPAVEMEKILKVLFDQIEEAEDGSNGLKIIALGEISQALFLIGTREEIAKAEQLIEELESQVGDAQQKVVHWYTVKHSNAAELAAVLERIYQVLVQERCSLGDEPPREGINLEVNATAPTPPPMPPPLPFNDFYQVGDVAVNPAPVTLTPSQPDFGPPPLGSGNFIVDIKTGAIVMVVERDILPQMEEVIKKLDVPKKMVQIEVLLFEKKISDRTDFGMNLLRIGDVAENCNRSGLSFNDLVNCPHKGILDFFFSRKCHGDTPAYDIAYRFLLSQDDVQINANPSALTVNQTTVKMAIVEEFSISTGVFEVPTVQGNGVALRDSFTRGQYGITLEITPTIHMHDCQNSWNDNTPNYVTLDTTVNFDTVQFDPIAPNRPIVTRRNIHNEVAIPDGETVILGGLRRKNTQDSKESIPFLGEIPGFGKLFSKTCMHDTSVEMFIFITPKIVSDPCDDLERVKYEQLCRRPGDIPEFMCILDDARRAERRQFLAGTMRMLFGRRPDGYFETQTVCAPNCIEVEYDGR